MFVVSDSFSSGPSTMVASRSDPAMRLAVSTNGREAAQPRWVRPMPTLLEPCLSRAHLTGEEQHERSLHLQCELCRLRLKAAPRPRLPGRRVCFLELVDGLVLQVQELGELGQVHVLPLLDEGVGLVTSSAPAARSLLAVSQGLSSGCSSAVTTSG